MSTEQTGRSRRSSLSFKSITRMLSRDGRVPKHGTDPSNELRRTALASAASLALPDTGPVLLVPTSRDNLDDDLPTQQTVVEDSGLESPHSDSVTPPGALKAEQPIAGSEICDSSTGSKMDAGAKLQKKETKRLQKEKRDLEKQLRRTEDEEEKRESRSTKRESRRLSKKQPLRSSSKSSSIRSVMRSSTTPVFSSFRRSMSGSRASSSHGNPTTDTTDQTIPTLSGPWPERFGAAVSRELASGKQPPYSSYSAPSHTDRSLHPTGKFSDLRASARLSQNAGAPENPRVQSMDVSLLYQRQLSSDVADTENPEGNKENKPNEGYRRSLVDPYTLLPYDTVDVEPEQRSGQRASGTPRFYANLHNIQGLAGSESTLKGVARRCPSAYVAPGDTKQKERSRLSSSNLTPNTVENPPKHRNVGANGIWTPSSGTARTERNRYTAVFKSSSTPVPTYTRENFQRSSMLPSRLRSKHTRFTSSPLASSSTDSPDLESNMSQINKSAPVLLLSQGSSVKPQLPELKCGELELFPSSQEKPVESAGGINSQPSLDKSSRDSSESRPGLSAGPGSTREESNGPPIFEGKPDTPIRSFSSKPVPRKPIPQHVVDGQPPARSRTSPENRQLSRNSPVDSAADLVAHPGNETVQSLPHARIKHDIVTSVNSETTSERYSTASENASTESQPHNTVTSRRTPSPTFNLFGNGIPPANAVPQTHKNIMALQADPRHTATPSNTPGLPANSSALRHNSHSGPIAKVFVICCQCNFWHDMPSNIYAKLASPHNTTTTSPPNAASGAGSSSSRSGKIEYSNGTAARRRSSENKSSIDVNRNSSQRGQNEANTSIKVIPNTSKEENSNAARGSSDDRLGSSLRFSNSVSGVRCSWCDHGMRQSCCAGWSTTVYMQKQLH